MPRDLLFCIWGRAPAIPFLRAQLMEQCLGVPQVGGVESLGEPVIDVREHRAGLVALALLRK